MSGETTIDCQCKDCGKFLKHTCPTDSVEFYKKISYICKECADKIPLAPRGEVVKLSDLISRTAILIMKRWYLDDDLRTRLREATPDSRTSIQNYYKQSIRMRNLYIIIEVKMKESLLRVLKCSRTYCEMTITMCFKILNS